MRRNAGIGLAGLLALAARTPAAPAQACPPGTRPGGRAAPGQAGAPGAAAANRPQVKAPTPGPSANDPRLKKTVATVNGEPVAVRELIGLLGEFQIPPGSEQRAYDAAIELLVNTKLLE